MTRMVVAEEVAMSQGAGGRVRQTCNLSLLALAALLTKEFVLTECVPWLARSWEKAGLVETAGVKFIL